MSQGIESPIDWTASPKPSVERVGPGLASRQKAQPSEKRNVMDTLLGNHSLTAIDASGSDPYNTTGRYFRR